MSKRFRPAVAMVELIFAIVVMGIALMSAPMLISTAASTTSVALQQEGINEAASRINMILTYAWDQNDVNDSCVPPLLHVNSGDDELNMASGSVRRAGVPLETNSHTFKCGAAEFNASNLVVDGSDDIDDFEGNSSLIVDSSGSGGKDYIEQTTISMATTVSYINDNASYNSQTLTYVPGAALTGTNTSNIKQIQVTLTSSSSASELSKTIVLKAFSCNIGGFEYESRGL